MSDAKTRRLIETSLELGAKGYSSASAVDGVTRFDHGSVRAALPNAETPSYAEMLARPEAVPLLMTPDGTLWQPAELGNRLIVTLRAIAGAVGVEHDADLDTVYRKVAEMAGSDD